MRSVYGKGFLDTRSDLKLLNAALEAATVISTDVFDTLLLRTVASERSRVSRVAQLFAARLARDGLSIPADLLLETRLRVQRLAFRALNVGARGEVRLADVVSRQLRVLSLPQSHLDALLRIELDVELESLVANTRLADVLRERKRAGARIVAVSDTTLSGSQVAELITRIHGADLIDCVYSSADHGSTKRRGELFSIVSQHENVRLNELVHIGDDDVADVRVPTDLGVRTHHAQRAGIFKYARLADGATTEVGRRLRALGRSRAAGPLASTERLAFARRVFGPIVTEFCVLIWLYAVQAEQAHRPVLLFCARGGLSIREAFERVLAKFDLPLQTPRMNLMVSRLVAARAALLARSDSVLEELDREFHRDTFGAVAHALGARGYALDEAWQRPFVAREFIELLYSGSGADVLSDIQTQNALFERHLRGVAQGANRLLLCDTGLYGSTQRLLADGFPDLAFETLQFARSNYKGHGEQHFPRVAGLVVEDNFYNPLRDASCVLRYWQLIESLFEPQIGSVRSFEEDESGEIIANCGRITRESLRRDAYSDRLAAVLSFIDDLSPDGGAAALAAAEPAWRQLTHAITRPSAADLLALAVDTRSVDFGRSGSIDVLSAERSEHFSARLKSLKSQHWREGAVVRDFPFAKHALLPALSSAHVMRRLLGRRFG